MASRSSRRKSASGGKRDDIARLLRDGAMLRDPSAGLLRTASELEALGLAQPVVREYVVCADPQDKDFPPRNRHCRGRIYLDADLDEPGHEYRCPECERPVFPRGFGKKHHRELRARVLPEGVKSYIRKELATLKVDVKGLGDGAFRVDLGDVGVFLCIVDYCGEDRLHSRDWAKTNPTCYVTVNPDHDDDRFLPENWLTKVTLADVVAGKANLGNVLKELAAAAPPVDVVDASVPVYSKTVSPIVAESRSRYDASRRFVVEVGPRTIRVEGEEVVAPQAVVRFRVFGILWKQFLQDLSYGLQLDRFKSLKLSEIVKRLEEEKQESVEDVEAIRKAINRLQSDIETAVKRKLGLPISREDIIQTIPWKGYGSGEHGYQINPRTVCARPFQSHSA